MNNFQESEYPVQFENHQKTICSNIIRYFNRKFLLNVTLICNGEALVVHQLMLASCSQFFEDILITRTEPHPILIFTDIPKNYMELLLNFMYNGRVRVPKEMLSLFLKIAKKLQIRGLNYNELNFAQTHSQEELRVNATQNGSPVVIETVQQNRVQREDKNIVNQNTVEKEESRWLTSRRSSGSVKRQERGKKVINPFAVKSKSFTDSDSTTFDLSVPGPSKTSRNTSRTNLSATRNDSDVEIVDNAPSVVVINDTQVTGVTNLRRKVRSRRGTSTPVKASAPPTETYLTSDESDIVASSPKKPRRNIIVNTSADESDKTPSDIITSVGLKRTENADSNPQSKMQDKSTEELNKLGTKPCTNKDSNAKFTNEKIEEPFKGYTRTTIKSLLKFCAICGKNVHCIRGHAEKKHKIQSDNNIHHCKTCFMKYSIKKMLQLHRCKVK